MATPMETVQLVDGTGAPVGTASNPLQIAGGTGGSGGSGGTQASPSYGYVVSDTAGTQPIGAPADAAATSDTGAASLLALVKRGLANWTTLLARVPALVSGRIPVDGSGVTQPVSAAAPLPVSQPKLAAGPTTARTAVATGTTATAILAAGRSDEMVSLKNTGTVKAYIGGTAVTAANGWPLAVGESMTMDAKMAEGGISAILDTAQSTAGEIAIWRF